MGATVAVIIPTYNRAHLVTEAIESALNQTRAPDEIIVVDDGSTDDTWERLQTCPPPVRSIRQANQGRSAARNAGIAQCTADLICFLDSDDRLTPSSIEARAGWLESHPEDDVAYGYVARVDFDGNRVAVGGVPPPWPSGNLFAYLARYNVISVTSFLIRRARLPPPPYFDETLEVGEDWDFLLRVAARARFRYLDETVALYRHHTDMTMLPTHSADAARKARLCRDLANVQARIYPMPAFRALPAVQRAHIYSVHAMFHLRCGQPAPARACLRSGITAAPWYAPAYLLWAISWLSRDARAVDALLRGMVQARKKLRSLLGQ